MFFNIRVLAPLFLAASSLVNAHDDHEHSGVSLTARADGTKVAVVTCMDPRIEVDFILTQLGLKADTSYIVRNAGGRVKEALRSIIASQQFLGTSEVHVIHHTQCGMAGHSEGSLRKAFYSADDRSRAFMVNQMDFLPIRTTNFTESVLDDVALIQFHPLVKQGVKITGWVYNISSTGNDTMAQVYPHVVLQSPDILSGIFAHLDQADLARALRVCQLWNEWNDTLWSNLPTLTPVLRLVFPFVFTNDGDKYIHRVPLYQLDRHRFTSIARSVRHLDASLTPSRSFFSGFNPNIPALLLDLCEPCTPLFHNLRSLATECYNDAELLGVLSLLTPSLRSLDILIHHSASDYMYELLSGIKDRSNQLERLCIHYQQQEKSSDAAPVNAASVPRNTDSYVYLPPIVPALVKSLRTLSIPAPCMSIDTLFALSRLPLLESLAFTGTWASETHEDDWPELDSYAFSALSRLVMPSCSVRAAARLLLAIPYSAPLGEIDITCSGEEGSELSELCSAMVRFKVSLHSARIKITHPGRVQGALEALTACSRLETLVLDADAPTDLSDVELGAFFSRFPRMRAAHVGGHIRIRD